MNVLPKNTTVSLDRAQTQAAPSRDEGINMRPLRVVLKVLKKQNTVLSPSRSKHDLAVKLCTGVLVWYKHMRSSMFIRNDFSLFKIFPSRNIVSTVNLGCKLDLKKIALHARNAEYNPKV